MTEDQYNEIKQAAIDWQYLVASGGGIARKSDCEAWMIAHFAHYDLDEFTARHITNQITEGPRYFMCARDGTTWQELVAGRPAPLIEQYPDIVFEVYARGK